MLDTLKHSLKAQNILSEEESLTATSMLIAVSGGRDSMCLLHAMCALGFKPAVAHINYQLRGLDSDKDQALVEAFCKLKQLTLNVKKIDLKTKLDEQGGNLQERARDLRYAYFEELDEINGYDYIVTAHHLDDQIENVLIHTFRGVGPKRIAMQNGKRFRPLLDIKSDVIGAYAECEQVPYRLDSSNLTNDYDRNFIRNTILPQLIERDENVDKKLLAFSQSWEADQQLIDALIAQQIGDATTTLRFKKQLIVSTRYCYHLLKPFGYSQKITEDIYSAVNTIGAKFNSFSHQLIIDRNDIILKANNEQITLKELLIHYADIPNETELNNGQLLEVAESITPNEESRHRITVPLALIVFPIVIRQWRMGDSFQPKGMNGSRKKLKKLFVDHKVNLFEKQQIPILCNGDGEIIWVAGLQKDDRFEHTNTEGPYLICTYTKSLT